MSFAPVDLKGRRAVVSGASRGFGLEAARAFARAGASVMLFARSVGDLEGAKNAIASDVPDAVIKLCVGDVTSEADVIRLAQATESAFGGTDILLCNAGIWGPKGPVESIDFDEWTRATSINLFGPVVCARAFSEQLHASERGKVIILSGGGATKPMPMLSAYAATKAGVVRFGETLAEEWASSGIDVNMLAPGAMNTGMLDEILSAGAVAIGAAHYATLVKQRESGGASMLRAAQCCAYLASRRSDGVTGKLISAVWDPWERLDELREELQATDIYTLRRITPEDRGRTW